MAEKHAAKRWVEEHFPSSQGSTKAALILAYGSGLDAGLIEAQEAIEQMMTPQGGITSTDPHQVVSKAECPATTEGREEDGEWFPVQCQREAHASGLHKWSDGEQVCHWGNVGEPVWVGVKLPPLHPPTGLDQVVSKANYPS